MKFSTMRHVVILLTTAVFSSPLLPAQAAPLTLRGISGTWSSPIGGRLIEENTDYQWTTPEGITLEGQQIRWGRPAGNISPGKSGLGFVGNNTISNLAAEQVFTLGRFTHFNKTIAGGTEATGADLTIDLNFGPQIGLKSFDFTMTIDETVNDPLAYPNNQCPYHTVGGRCSDKVTWVETINEQNTFSVDNQKYQLSLFGFSNQRIEEMTDDQQVDIRAKPVQQFISQEGGDSHAFILAQIQEYSEPIPKLPEPAALAGLGLFGLATLRSRRA